MKWLCIAVLFVAFALRQRKGGYEFVLNVVVCSGAATVAVQAFHAGRHRWLMCFLAVAFLFNPVVQAFPLDSNLGLAAIVLTAASFGVSLTALKSQPVLSIPSITDRNPGSESL